jgi:hypothetical protein
VVVARNLRAVILIALGLVLLLASAAFAGTITAPTGNPYVWPGDANGDPTFVTVTGSGFPVGASVYVIECDGVSPATGGWTPNNHCDNITSPAAAIADGSGNVTFGAADANHQFKPVKGDPGSGLFNCYSPGHATGLFPGGFHPGIIDPGNGLPSYINCQVMLSTSRTAVTANQAFLTFQLPDAPTDPPPTSSTSTTAATTTTAAPTTTTTTTPGSTTTTTAPGGSTTTSDPSSTTTTTSDGSSTSSTSSPGGTTTTVFVSGTGGTSDGGGGSSLPFTGLSGAARALLAVLGLASVGVGSMLARRRRIV